MNKFIRSCGFALCFGGALTILINVVISPFMPASKDGAVVMLTDVYLLRQSASGVAALLLLAGSIGLHLAQRPASGWLGTIAFLISFVGGCALFAVEFVDVFVLRAVAQIAPEMVAPLDKSPLLNIGFASAASLFALGWISLSHRCLENKNTSPPRRAGDSVRFIFDPYSSRHPWSRRSHRGQPRLRRRTNRPRLGPDENTGT